ncbi:MAG: DUF721 domain-containing protein [Holosporaceae bacterium]|jgi:hypothetical protein|nr:DUF721 domain-containing protein [Holosporaceae bacterium]
MTSSCSAVVAASRISEKMIQNFPGVPNYLDIFLNWDRIIGEKFSSVCKPLKVVNIGKNKILVLKTIRGRGLEIQHMAIEILLLLNTFLNNKTFSQIKVVQTDFFTWEK